jgi:hypothetical protein
MIFRSNENSHYFFFARRTLLNLAFKKNFYKFTDIHFTALPAEANPPGKWGLVASKLMKESEKHIYGKKSLWLLCVVYSMATNPLSHVHLSPHVPSLCKYLYMSSQPLACKGKYFERDPIPTLSWFLSFCFQPPLSAITAPACLSLNISSLCVAYLFPYTEPTHVT